jgi:hypothetical protein
VTWLPVAPGAASEREAALGLQPEAWRLLREALELSWSIAEPRLLDLCRLRMAAALGCRAEPAPAARTERERAALAYAEQFTVDQNAITDEQKEAVARHLSLRELVDFVQALNVHDGYLRVLALLDVAPDPDGPGKPPARARPRRAVEPAELPAGPRARLRALADPTFFAARSAFGAATARLGGIDELTTECCRLRNASHQACAY